LPLQWVTAANCSNSNGAAWCLLQKDVGKIKGGLKVPVDAASLPAKKDVARLHTGALRLGICDDLFYDQAFFQSWQEF
jgi:hypothetical protein